jgi:hypothetical protein
MFFLSLFAFLVAFAKLVPKEYLGPLVLILCAVIERMIILGWFDPLVRL